MNTIIITFIPNKTKTFLQSINMSNQSQNRQGQNPPQNKLERIAEIQNLLQNEIEQITRTQNLAKDDYQIKKILNLLQDKLEQTTKMQTLLQNGL